MEGIQGSVSRHARPMPGWISAATGSGRWRRRNGWRWGDTGRGRAEHMPWDLGLPSSPEFPLFSYNNGVVMRSCRELDNSRSGLSAASAFAIATSGANEGTPNKEKYRRLSLASTGAGRGRGG